jgi:hypothetical protein
MPPLPSRKYIPRAAEGSLRVHPPLLGEVAFQKQGQPTWLAAWKLPVGVPASGRRRPSRRKTSDRSPWRAGLRLDAGSSGVQTLKLGDALGVAFASPNPSESVREERTTRQWAGPVTGSPWRRGWRRVVGSSTAENIKPDDAASASPWS